MQRIWIELEKPADAADAKIKCDLVNNMIKRLADPADMPHLLEFRWSEHDQLYRYGGVHGWTVLEDNGEWFNLEYLGRP
jgi:hypothetical protein